MSQPPRTDHEAVLEHLDWVQRLALRLCVDAAQAEDVSQESLLAAFRRVPGDLGDVGTQGIGGRTSRAGLRRWLGGIVRNQARMARRGAGRRGGIEARAARPEAQPSAAELLERVDTQRAVVEALRGLAEPYRTSLLRRYFDGLGPAEIARLEGVPEATVKTRLRRGLAQLRERLGDELGDEGDGAKLYGALAPLALMELRRTGTLPGPVGAPSGPALGAALPGGPALMLAAALAGTLAAGWFALSRSDNEAAATEPLAVRGPGPGGSFGPDEAGVVGVTEPGERRLAPNSPTPAVSGRAPGTGTAAAAALRVNLRALDLDGRAVGGLEVDLTDGELGRGVGRTDGRGALSFDSEPRLGQLSSGSDDWITVVPGTVFPYGRETDVSLVVARPRRVDGVVTGPDGQPVRGAEVRYGTELDLRTRFELPLDRAVRTEWFATTDDDGAYAFERVPELPGARVAIEAWGMESCSVALPAAGDALADCTLTPLAATTAWVEGRVLLPDGGPAAGAAVSLGTYAVLADGNGRFRIAGEPEGGGASGAELWAALAGYGPVRAERPEHGWPEELELVLEAATYTLAGRVVDTGGRPLAGVEVDLADPGPFGYVALERSSTYLATTLEAICAGGRSGVRTDGEGRFELRGLRRRGYALVLRERAGLRLTIAGPFEAGHSDGGGAAGGGALELTLRDAEPLVPVAGRIVDDRGEPLARARVRLVRRDGELAVSGPPVQVGADGRFDFGADQPADAELHAFAGGGYSIVATPLDTFSDPGAIELVLPRTGSFFVQRGGAPGEGERQDFDHFTLEDRDGRAVRLQQVDGEGAFTLDRGHFEGARSPVYRAPRGTRWLVLWRDGREVERIVLDLAAGPPTRIDL